MLQKWRHKNGSTVLKLTSQKDRNCDMCLRTKITRVPCRRRNEGSIPRAEKFGDLMTADHKVLKWRKWIPEQSPVRCRDKISPLSGYNLIRVRSRIRRRRKIKLSTKFSRAVTKAKSYWNRQFIRIWQFLWIIVMESSNVYTFSLRNERILRRVKEGVSAVLLQSGLEKSVWTKIWWIFQRTNCSISCTGGIPPKLRERQKLEFINSERKYYQESF